MKILYGVVGEGMGHAVRSRVVLEHLLSQGHDVEIMASSRAADFLARRFSEVHRIHGLHIIYEDNRVRRGRTLLSNVRAGTAALPKQVRSYFELVEDFAPDVVISDFESWVYLYAKLHRLPILSVDNMQVLSRCKHPPEILAGIRGEFRLQRAFVRSKLPFCDHYLITTFFYPELRRPDTTLLPPILRPEILAATPSRGEHLLVYQTAEGNEALPALLEQTGLPCRVYGMRRELQADVQEGNLLYRPFDEARFIADLASARAVISGGGFTVLGECVYLHKPTFALPVAGQIEQVINGRYLQHLGYGQTAPSLDQARLTEFLDRTEAHAERLERYRQDGNRLLFECLTAQLDRAAAGL